MRRYVVVILSLLVACAPAARAEHAAIDLSIYHLDPVSRTLKGQSSSRVDEEPPQGGVNPRPVFKVKANEPLILEFIYTNTYPHGEIKDVSVRYFVVRVDKVGQKKPANLENGTVTQGKFDLNFKPGSRVGAKVRFTIATPGVYLLRVQSEKTKSDHEHFAAIDLQVE
jgi:hypothetical protein